MRSTDLKRMGGPTPWHPPKFPNGQPSDGNRIWKDLEPRIGGESRIGFVNQCNEIFVLIGFYWYSFALTSNLWLLWRQYRAESMPPDEPAEVQFRLLDLESASPIADVGIALDLSSHRNSRGIRHNGRTLAERNYVADFHSEITKISVPPEFAEIGNVLVLADIGSSAGYEADFHVAILDFDFRNQVVTTYPHDWFNKGSLDFDYQWISRVWRDENRRICGEGVRIGDFRLDSTGRHLDRSFFGSQ